MEVPGVRGMRAISVVGILKVEVVVGVRYGWFLLVGVMSAKSMLMGGLYIVCG